MTYDDCVGLGHFTEEEIQAIAEHEHVPEIVALQIGEYVIQGDDGVRRIRRIIVDDIEHAEQRGDTERHVALRAVLAHFIATHPERAV